MTGALVSPQDVVRQARCANCGTPMVGRYCHNCGQVLVAGRLSATDFLKDMGRRVLRLDAAYGKTIWRTLRSPGALVNDYLDGRRGAIQDPLQYFISSAFTQVVVSSVTLVVAPVMGRTSALSWLGVLGGMVAIKFVSIVWVAVLWWTLFNTRARSLGEILVFVTYVAGTTSLLWSALPLLDLILPFDLARGERSVGLVTLGVEVLYASYAVHSWLHRSLPLVFIGVSIVLGVGYLVLATVVGTEQAVSFASLSGLAGH